LIFPRSLSSLSPLFPPSVSLPPSLTPSLINEDDCFCTRLRSLRKRRERRHGVRGRARSIASTCLHCGGRRCLVSKSRNCGATNVQAYRAIPEGWPQPMWRPPLRHNHIDTGDGGPSATRSGGSNWSTLLWVRPLTVAGAGAVAGGLPSRQEGSVLVGGAAKGGTGAATGHVRLPSPGAPSP
jgi:hypothetical protein